jgi:hypothetical protein
MKTILTTAVSEANLPPMPDVSLIDYFVTGNPIYMSIITLLFIGVLFAAWKAPSWVKETGLLALSVSVFMSLVGLFQIFRTIVHLGECSFSVLCSGFQVAMLPMLYGICVYVVSLIIRIAQKPRL